MTTDLLPPGTRVRLLTPHDPAFDGLAGTVLRWHTRYGMYAVRLDRWPDHQHRLWQPPDRRQDDILLDPDELEPVAAEPRKEIA